MNKKSEELTKKEDKSKNLPLVKGSTKVVARTVSSKKAGVKLLPSISVPPNSAKRNIPTIKNVYKYRLLPGNNVRLILAALRKRPWWHSSSSKPLVYKRKEANDVDDDNSSGSSSSSNSPPPAFIWEMYRNSKRYKSGSYSNTMLNHLQKNNCLVSKKGLYFSLRVYCKNCGIDPCTIIPRTFYLSSGQGHVEDDLSEFMSYCEGLNSSTHTTSTFPCIQSEISEYIGTSSEEAPPKCMSSEDAPPKYCSPAEDQIWILKPASMTNRGFGIKVVRGLSSVLEMIRKKSSSKSADCTNPESSRSIKVETEEENVPDKRLATVAKRIASQDGWIVQVYMERPLLVAGRKFDIRSYVLVTHCQKQGLKAYFYRDSYVRTSCKKYSLKNISDREAHLTNDAVQKHSKAYGKFESGNKLSFEEWQHCICQDYPGTRADIVENQIYPAMKRLAKHSIAAAAQEMSKTDQSRSFELLGYDFMVDDNFNPILIEINSNPCLELVCPLLRDVITALINNVVTVALDPHFTPPPPDQRTRACVEAIEVIESEENRFESLYPTSMY